MHKNLSHNNHVHISSTVSTIQPIELSLTPNIPPKNVRKVGWCYRNDERYLFSGEKNMKRTRKTASFLKEKNEANKFNSQNPRHEANTLLVSKGGVLVDFNLDKKKTNAVWSRNRLSLVIILSIVLILAMSFWVSTSYGAFRAQNNINGVITFSISGRLGQIDIKNAHIRYDASNPNISFIIVPYENYSLYGNITLYTCTNSGTIDWTNRTIANGWDETGVELTNSTTIGTYSNGIIQIFAGQLSNVTALYISGACRGNTYNVAFHSNFGAGSSKVQTNLRYGVESTLTLNSTSQEFTRTGYEFAGWSRSQGANNSVDYMDGARVKDLGSITLYAVWKAGVYAASVIDGSPNRIFYRYGEPEFYRNYTNGNLSNKITSPITLTSTRHYTVFYGWYMFPGGIGNAMIGSDGNFASDLHLIPTDSSLYPYYFDYAAYNLTVNVSINVENSPTKLRAEFVDTLYGEANRWREETVISSGNSIIALTLQNIPETAQGVILLKVTYPNSNVFYHISPFELTGAQSNLLPTLDGEPICVYQNYVQGAGSASISAGYIYQLYYKTRSFYEVQNATPTTFSQYIYFGGSGTISAPTIPEWSWVTIMGWSSSAAEYIHFYDSGEIAVIGAGDTAVVNLYAGYKSTYAVALAGGYSKWVYIQFDANSTEATGSQTTLESTYLYKYNTIFLANGTTSFKEIYVFLGEEGWHPGYAPSCNFTWTNYVFVEWNTMPDGSGDSYQVGDELKFRDDITLYAIWDNDKWTITVRLYAGSTIGTATHVRDETYYFVKGSVQSLTVVGTIIGQYMSAHAHTWRTKYEAPYTISWNGNIYTFYRYYNASNSTLANNTTITSDTTIKVLYR